MAYDPNDEADIAIMEGIVAERTAPLVAKRDELLNEVKALRKDGGKDNTKLIETLEAKVEKYETDLAKANGDVRTLTTRATKAEKLAETSQATTKSLLVDNGLTAALTGAKVAPQFLGAAKALFASSIEIKDVDGKPTAMVGDKPLSEHITTWAASAEGKHFVGAPGNTGGGARPAQETEAKTMVRGDFDAMTPMAKMEFSTSGGVVTDA